MRSSQELSRPGPEPPPAIWSKIGCTAPRARLPEKASCVRASEADACRVAKEKLSGPTLNFPH
jgi:hypothetical protein